MTMNDLFFKITVEGVDISDFVDSLQVDESDSRCNMASLTLGDSNLVLSDLLCEGLSIEIDLGYCDAHTVIFRGLITDLQANFPSRGQPVVSINAMDSLISLGFEPQTQNWGGRNISDVVRKIALKNHFSPGMIEAGVGTTDPNSESTNPLRQVEKTDLEFLLELAREYDAKLYIEHRGPVDTLNFVATQRLLDAEPIEEPLVFNANLDTFSVSIESSMAAAEMRLVTTDPETGDRIVIEENLVGPNDATWVPDPERIAQTGPGAARLTALATRVVAKQQMIRDYWQRPPRVVGAPARPESDRSRTLGDRARRLGQSGRGQARGSFWLRPYRRVQVEGCGGRWSGNSWYLSQVTHQLDVTQRSYTCSFSCTR